MSNGFRYVNYQASFPALSIPIISGYLTFSLLNVYEVMILESTHCNGTSSFMVVISFNKYSWNVLCQLFQWVLLLIWKRKEKGNPLSAMSEQQFCWAASSPINHHHPSVSSQLPLLLTSPTHNLQYALIKNLTSNKSLLLIPAHEKQNRRVKLFEIYPILF